jgi:2-polyprenyl-6-methoxyphenol hydroxylase-like FAD-dependent oxidoreductase
MRVLISGGGIAGLTLAYWLHHYGIPAVVLEQAQAIRRDGYAIDFLGTGYAVAERMGIIDRLAAHQIPFSEVLYVNKEGKPVARMDVALMRSLTRGKYLGLMHATLEEVLYDALAGQVEVRFGRSLTHLVDGADGVTVTLNDGTTESFDLVIGADGVHSITRSLVFGPEAQFSRYLGYTVASYLLADHYGISSTLSFQMFVQPERMAAAYCTEQPDQILIFFMYHSPQQEHVPRDQRLPRLREVFAGMGWLTDRFLADVDPAAPLFMDTVVQIQMPTWHRGRVALVGDACDCPTLVSGQGASLAMGGAYLLARALHETGDYEQAFQRYEQQMYGFVQEQQKHGRSFAKSFVPGSPLGLMLQRAMIKVLLRPAFGGLMRRYFGAESLPLGQDARPVPAPVAEESLPRA